MSNIYERAIARICGPKYVTSIVMENAANYRGDGLQFQEKYLGIMWVPCGAHSLSHLLKDIGKMSFMHPNGGKSCSEIY